MFMHRGARHKVSLRWQDLRLNRRKQNDQKFHLSTAAVFPWMKEAMDNTSRVGVCLRCPVFISVHFSLRNEGSSEYIRLCEGGESLSPNFQTFHDPRHQFHGISTLVSGTLHPLATLALLHMIPWTFLHSLNVWKFRLWWTMSVCYVTLSQTPCGLNLCHIMKTVHKT
jgi:hypothetical protein